MPTLYAFIMCTAIAGPGAPPPDCSPVPTETVAECRQIMRQQGLYSDGEWHQEGRVRQRRFCARTLPGWAEDR